jgi:hypothetical protein
MAVDEFLPGFIRKMQEEYGGILRQSQPAVAPLNGQSVPDVMPVGGSFDGPGLRYTGKGPDNALQPSEPAGVAHEHEMVVESDMVEDAGGPEAIRSVLERLRKLEKEKPGYQAGTGSSTVPSMEDRIKSTQKATSSMGANTPGTSQINPDFTPKTYERYEARPGTGMDNPLSTYQSDPSKPLKPGDIPYGSIPGTSDYATLKATSTEGKNKPQSIMKTGLVEGVNKPQSIMESYMVDQKIPTEGAPGEVPTEGVNKPQSIMESHLVEPEIAPTEKPPETDMERASRLGLSGLEDIARGESDAARMEREKAQAALAGERAAAKTALGQRLAASEASPEAARAGMAQLDMQLREAQVDLESRLAMSAAERAEAATQKLAELGTDGVFKEKQLLLDERRVDNETELVDIKWDELEQNDEAMAFAREKWQDTLKLDWSKFGLDEKQINALIETNASELDLQWTKFRQDVTEHGMDYALRERAMDWTINSSILQTALENGDYDSATAIAKMHGFDLDFSDAQNARNQQVIGDSMANIISTLEINPNADFENADIQNNLNRAADALGLSGKKRTDWMQDTFEGVKATNDRIYSLVASLLPSTIEGMISGGDPDFNIHGFEYGRATGVEAGRRLLTNVFATDGITTDDLGNVKINYGSTAFKGTPMYREPTPDDSDEEMYKPIGPGQFEFIENLTQEEKEKAEREWARRNSSGSAGWNDAKMAQAHGVMDSYSVGTVPKGGKIQELSDKNQSGYVNIDGTVYKFIDDGADNRYESVKVKAAYGLGYTKIEHDKYIHVKTEDGIDYWIDDNNKWWVQKPNELIKNEYGDEGYGDVNYLMERYTLNGPPSEAQKEGLKHWLSGGQGKEPWSNYWDREKLNWS